MSAHGKLESWKNARQNVCKNTPARERLGRLFDEDSFVEIDSFAAVDGQPCGVVCGYGSVMGSPAYAFAQDSTENGGAVGAVHATKITKIYDLALKTGVPVVGIYDSNGARVSEGVGALDAYGKILLRVNNLSGVVPQIALVLGTCAGTSAMLACSADFVVMSRTAQLFMTPPAFSGDEDGAGSAQNAALAGVAQIMESDEAAACAAVRKLLTLLPLNNLAAPPICDYTEPSGGEGILTAVCQGDVGDQDPVAIVQSVCDADSAIELLSDFGKSVYTAAATLGGLPVGVVATRPGLLDADGCTKIAKIVSVFDSFQVPVLSFVNTAGFTPSAKAELCGSVREMAKLAHVYAEATTPKIAVITGEAYGAAYVALCSRAANADYTVAWPSAILSPLPPRTAVAFLHGDEITKDKPREAVEESYILNEASPLAAAAGGYIDDVIDPAATRSTLLSSMDLLSAKRVSRNPKKHANIPM